MSQRKHTHKIIQRDSETSRILLDYFMPKFRNGYVEIDEEKYLLPIDYLRFEESYDNFEVKNSDVYIASHPKTGNVIL